MTSVHGVDSRLAGSDPRRLGLDALFWCVPVTLWLFTLYFTYKYATNVPYADSWEYTELALGLRPATLSVLWEQHNEHRIVLQRLFQLLLARYTAWDQYLAAFPAGLFLGAGNLCFLWQVARTRPHLTTVPRLLLLGTLSLWLFNFRQY